VDYINKNPVYKPLAVEVTPEEALQRWDGCSRLPASFPSKPNVYGLGPVAQVGAWQPQGHVS
jgi:hypothetical protein